VREYVREQVLNATRGEVPHAVAVTIDRYEDGPLVRIAATIHVEKVGQRRILIGEGGAMLVRIGSAARKRIEAMIGKRSYLELFVRVTERWKNAPRMLTELGYEVSDLGSNVDAKTGTRPVRRRRKKQS
jgi:GTPase